MKLLDLFRRHGLVNGATAPYPRPWLISPTSQPEPLAQRRARLIGEEREVEARLLAVRSALDDVTTEMMAAARGQPIEQTRIRGLAALFEMSIDGFARHCTPGVLKKIFRAGLHPEPAVPALHPAQPSGKIDPAALAKAIVKAGKVASAEAEEELPADEKAAAVVAAGRAAMNLPPLLRTRKD
jgi:hypothetical protein